MEQNKIKSKLLRNLGANAYGQFITVAIQIASLPLFLHYWGVELYGEWLILSAIPAYLSLSDIGFASVAANDMTIRVANGDNQGALEVYQSIWIFICIVSTLVGCLLAFFIYIYPLDVLFSIRHISVLNTKQTLFVLVLYVLFSLQSGVLSAAFRSVGRYAYGSVMNNTIRFVEWLLSLLALVLGGGVLILATTILLVRLSGLIVMWYVLRKQVPWLRLGFEVASLKIIKELRNPAVAFMAFPLGLALSLQGIVLAIGILLGSAAVVMFSAYRTLTRILVQVITMINQAIWPEVSSVYGEGKLDIIFLIHRKGSSITFWLALFAIITLGFSAEWIIEIWTHHTLEQNYTLLFLLLVTTFLNVQWQTSWVVLMATNQHQKISIIFIVSSVCGLILSILVMPLIGLNGVGLALIIAEIPMLYLAIDSTLVILGDNWKDYLKSVISNPINIHSVKL